MSAAIMLACAAALLLWPRGSTAGHRLTIAVTSKRTGARPGNLDSRGHAAHRDAPHAGAWPEVGTTQATSPAGRDATARAARLLALCTALPEPMAEWGRRLLQRPSPPSADDAWLVDLVSALFAAGLDAATALSAAGAHSSSATAQALRRAGAGLALGTEPREVWGPRSGGPEVVIRLGAALDRSARSGAAVTDSLSRVAEWARAQETARRRAAAERAGVLIAGPLGLCFLPAFVCLGIAPVVAGLAARILPGVLG